MKKFETKKGKKSFVKVDATNLKSTKPKLVLLLKVHHFLKPYKMIRIQTT